MQRYTLNILFGVAAIALVVMAQTNVMDKYVLQILMLIGINCIFATSLNLVNGYMGEFSCGHGGFMCVGAYVGSLLSVAFFTDSQLFGNALFGPEWALPLFPLVLFGAMFAAALAGLLVALPSFKTRDDYLAIITIAANYIIISLIENIDAIGGPRGFLGMKKTVNAMADSANAWVDYVISMLGFDYAIADSDYAISGSVMMLVWTLIGVFVCVMVIRRLMTSTYGKGVSAVCQNEVAAEMMGVNTNRVKVMAFMVSSGLGGLAGVLYAHVYGYVNAQSFGLLKSTEGLVMVYLGGMGSISGVLMAAIAFTLLIELLRFIIPWLNTFLHETINVLPANYQIDQVWTWVFIPLMLILLMRFRPEGFLGNRELAHFLPGLRRWYTLK
ncbi:MAG: branched-chain amino acid ABC transporter permease [Burkholderiales bacterium]|jgi:branched-chain amino acid transport system permease protein|nr:branched-chain amino acid ABC transporter permease [Burkholderiales bacterium]